MWSGEGGREGDIQSISQAYQNIVPRVEALRSPSPRESLIVFFRFSLAQEMSKNGYPCFFIRGGKIHESFSATAWRHRKVDSLP